MKRVQQGFTLIELMIVVAIVAILAAVAIPQYQNYTIRAKLGNALTAAESLKTAVALCAQETGGLTDCDAGSNGIPASAAFTATKEVASADVTDGVITITLATGIKATDVDGKKIKFTPGSGTTGITWCISTNVAAAYSDIITKNSVGTCTAPT